MKRVVSFAGRFLCLLALVWVYPVHATVIQDVVSVKGIHAWLVQDDKLPLISISFAFRGGVEQDPADKQGLADLTSSLMTEGAGSYDASAFQQQLADHSISMGFAAERDSIHGNMKMLRTEADTGFDLLRVVLTQPRFDEKEIENKREQQLTALRMQLGNPGWQARYGLFQKIFANHPYGQRHLGSIHTLSSITANDIKDFAANHLARDNLVIVVAGSISASELRVVLDQVFDGLPHHAKSAPIHEVVWPSSGETILIPREGTQTELMFALPGPKHDDPDWYAAEIADYILGSGGFSSRLMQEVRDKKGLTYGIGTGLSSMDHAGAIIGNAAVDNVKAGQAWDTILDTMHHFYEDGVSEKEISAAKDYLTGSLPLAMTSTDRISGALLGIQLQDLGRDYLDRRNDLIRKVTTDEVNHAIRRWFDPDHLTLSMVGKPEGITPSRTQSLVRD